MLADLTREDEGDAVDAITLRLAAAHARGVREGIEMAAKWHDDQAAELERRITNREGQFISGMDRTARIHRDDAQKLRALSPPPAEPTGMTADGWIAWIGGECPVPGCTIVEAQHRNGECSSPRPAHEVDWDRYPLPRNAWDVVAYRIVKPAEPSAPVAPEEAFHNAVMAIGEGGRILDLEDEVEEQKTRITALEAENAKLRERNAALEDGLRPFAAAAGHALDAFGVGKSVTLAVLDRVAAYFVDWTHYRRARALAADLEGTDAP